MFSITGEQGIILPSDSATESDSRPTSATSTERPASSTSSHTGAIIGNARVRLRELSEEKVDDPKNSNQPNLSTNKNNNHDGNINSSSANLQPSKQEQPSMEQPPSSSNNEEELSTTDNSNGIAKSQAYELEGCAPPNETKIEDIKDDLPPNVISRDGTPDTWAFDEKEGSLHAKPPRPNSSNLCSPPIPRKTPVSVDHHLRK